MSLEYRFLCRLASCSLRTGYILSHDQNLFATFQIPPSSLCLVFSALLQLLMRAHLNIKPGLLLRDKIPYVFLLYPPDQCSTRLANRATPSAKRSANGSQSVAASHLIRAFSLRPARGIVPYCQTFNQPISPLPPLIFV